jgi:hypothetical protein
MKATQTLAIAAALALLGGCADEPTEILCPASLECDDGRTCTVDTCNAAGDQCVWELLEDTCLIDGGCHLEGAVNPANPCMVCQPALNPRGWTLRPDGTTCAEGNQCVESSQCQEGVCDAPLLACDDSNGCTIDTCEPDSGCDYAPVTNGTACEDGDLCTTGEQCQSGDCGTPLEGCDDANPCTDDSCDPTSGCVNQATENPCDDGNPCTDDGICYKAECMSGEPLVCDDGNVCTIDVCDPLAGCHHIPDSGGTCDDGEPCTQADLCSEGQCSGGPPVICDDGNPCTVDSCSPGTGCTTEPVEGDPCCTEGVSICDDGDPCTVDQCISDTLECLHSAGDGTCDDEDACTTNDVCIDGLCAGSAVDCDDDNVCSLDSCDPVSGCLYEPSDGVECDDGLACSTVDICTAGTCAGDYAECLCIPDFHPDSVKCNSVGISQSDVVGFDLNGDGEVDNALAAIAALVNSSIDEALVDGDLMLLFEFRGPLEGDSSVAVYQGAVYEPCDFQNETCSYLVDPSFLVVKDGICAPLVSLPINIVGTKLTGGGPGTNFPFELPLGESVLDIELKNVVVSADLVKTNGEVIGMSGMIGGAIPEAELTAALEGLPEDALGDAFTPQQVIGLLSILVDIDTNADGVNDAVSVALLLDALDAKIVGYE